MKSKRKQAITTARDRELARFRRIQEQTREIVRIFHGAREEDPRFWPTALRLAAAKLEQGLHRRVWKDRREEYEDSGRQQERKPVYRVALTLE